MKPFAIATCIALLVPASAFAAEEETLVRGARVRVTSASSSGARFQGTLASLDATTLTIFNDDHQMVNVSRAQITKVEVGWGRKGNLRKGLLVGALAGVSMTAYAAVFDPNSLCPTWGTCSSGEKVGMAAGMVVVSAGIGAAAGAVLFKTDRWVATPLDKVHVAAGPVRGGMGASVSLRF